MLAKRTSGEATLMPSMDASTHLDLWLEEKSLSELIVLAFLLGTSPATRASLASLQSELERSNERPARHRRTSSEFFEIDPESDAKS